MFGSFRIAGEWVSLKKPGAPPGELLCSCPKDDNKEAGDEVIASRALKLNDAPTRTIHVRLRCAVHRSNAILPILCFLVVILLDNYRRAHDAGTHRATIASTTLRSATTRATRPPASARDCAPAVSPTTRARTTARDRLPRATDRGDSPRGRHRDTCASGRPR